MKLVTACATTNMQSNKRSFYNHNAIIFILFNKKNIIPKNLKF